MLELDVGRLTDFAREHALSLVVLFGSQAHQRARPGSDTDLALMPARDNLDHGQRLRTEGELGAALGRRDLDLVWLPWASWLLTWEVAQGKLLYEERPGLFRDFQSVAWLRRADSQVWVERDRAYLKRSLEGSWRMNLDLLRRKLTGMSRYLRELEVSVAVPPAQFVANPVHYTAERLTQLLVDAAVAVNTEVSQVVAGIPPSDYYSSFFSLASTGWIDQETAQVLAPLAQLRNRLVHDYEVVELSELYTALSQSLVPWRRYLTSVHSRLEDWSG